MNDRAMVVCLGEILIDFMPEQSGQALERVPAFQRAAGGAPANVAAAVAKLGGASRFIGKVGSDAFGNYLHSTLIAAGVEAALVETEEARTGLAFVSLRHDGERDFLFYRDPAADMLLKDEEIEEEWLEDAAIYHFGSVSLISEPCRTATLEAARKVKQAGGLISYDPNLRPALWPDEETMRQEVLQHIGLADVLKVSEEEASFLLQCEPGEAVQQLLDMGARSVVVTRGEEGCCVVTKRAMTLVPGVRVKAVDTTGAGDSFVGAMLFKLAESGITAERLEGVFSDEAAVVQIFRFANKVGAITTTRRGAIPALPTLAEVEAL
ncbi:PfkB family carbohydrate kinase [Paenibacillus doosanensis]|uniref:5-dehydro-2-deoxygluconokinase n=1 Tax=Paenibacillus konkukensis TaxID=2020716 RepID=A0ABY4RT60_9BACL|nr:MULTISPECIES: PfkB family carbohydrate kinase [Paenibacillus]MCS7463298.1 PfkB family carbohydrate kinase [Paenibacillus doosanensis]UQZ85165.1 5-dehydro-2-deoxygluconokinase [Paenibacillus konkukensis]